MDDERTDGWEQRLGIQLRALRIAQLLDQSELAARANIRPATLGALERGEGSSLRTLIRVTRALGRTEWLEALDPIGDGPSPIDLLRERRRKPARPQRVPRNRP